jgi:hypothetical protein
VSQPHRYHFPITLLFYTCVHTAPTTKRKLVVEPTDGENENDGENDEVKYEDDPLPSPSKRGKSSSNRSPRKKSSTTGTTNGTPGSGTGCGNRNRSAADPTIIMDILHRLLARYDADLRREIGGEYGISPGLLQTVSLLFWSLFLETPFDVLHGIGKLQQWNNRTK